jgi:hypothetical protein
MMRFMTKRTMKPYVALSLVSIATGIGIVAGWTALTVVAGFVMLAYLPGRSLLRIVGIEDDWSTSGQSILSVAISLSVVPFFLNALWHFTHDPWIMLLAAAIANTLLTVWQNTRDNTLSPNPTFEFRRTRLAMAFIGGLVLFSTVGSYWPTDLLGYPIPAEIHDFIKHHAVLSSLEQHRLPLGNVFYASGADAPVHYYHFFYLIPATIRLWTDNALSCELAFGLSAFLVAAATIGTAYLFAKRFFKAEAPAMAVASLFSIVGALDIVPAVIHMIDLGRPVVTLDTWAGHPYRIHNFLNQMIWSPQNVSGLLIVLVGAYLLSRLGSWRGWFWMGPILGASLLGSSVWVAIGALPALAVYSLTKRRILGGAILVGMLMLVLSIPTIIGYASNSVADGRGLSFSWPVNDNAMFGRLVGRPGIIANILNAPMIFVLEFGAKLLLLLIVPVSVWKRVWRNDGLRWLAIAAIIASLSFLVVRSELRHNDFGQKIILLSMAFTAIVAGGAIASETGPSRWYNPMGWRLATRHPKRWPMVMAIAVFALGLPVGLYEAPLTASRRYIDEFLRWRVAAPDQRQDMLDEGAAIAFIRDQLPPTAVIQAEGSQRRSRLEQMVNRQIGLMCDQDDILVFDPADRSALDRSRDELFTVLRTSDDPRETYKALRRHNVTHVFIGTVERQTWPHNERFDDTTLFRNVFVRGASRVVELKSD